MSTPRDPDSILAAWLEEGPNALPEPTKRAIAVNTRTMNQRRHQVWLPQRRPSMNPLARMAAAAVVIALAIGSVVYVLATPDGGLGGRSVASPAPTASPSPLATPTPAATPSLPSLSPSALAHDGFVYPGSYVPQFDPPMTFAIASEVQHNCAPNFRCRGSIDANLPGWLDLEFGLPRIEAQIVRVDKLNDPAHPGRLIDPPTDLATWIASRPGLTVARRASVEVGGLAATRLDVQIGNKDVGLGPIPGVADPGIGYGADRAYRLYVVAVHGHQVLISLSAEDGSIEEIQPLVDSIVWDRTR